MARLIYTAITSLDGYVADAEGGFEWAAPDEEVHAFVNDLLRPAGTHLHGRRMYEVMVYWETVPLSGQPPAVRDFAEIWRAADKIVYSTTLTTVTSARTQDVTETSDPAQAGACSAISPPSSGRW
jgi:dihydrofolate reductase